MQHVLSLSLALAATLLLQCGGVQGEKSMLEGDRMPASVEDWSGSYRYGDSLNVGAVITLHSGGFYEARVESCYGPGGSSTGRWSATEAEISFVQESQEGSFVVALNRAYKVVREDGVVLVPKAMSVGFRIYGPTSTNCFRRGEPYPNEWDQTRGGESLSQFKD